MRWDDCYLKIMAFDLEEKIKNGCYFSDGYEEAQQALKEIKE